MKIPVAHNAYQQPGGEDQVFAAKTTPLEARGHSVVRCVVHNDKVASLNSFKLAKSTLWNPGSYSDLRTLIQKEKPQVVHFHNTFPLISPAGYYAAKTKRTPVVQTLHNFRLLCSNALFFRDGRLCEDRIGKPPPWPGVLHGCYRRSRKATVPVATMQVATRNAGATNI